MKKRSDSGLDFVLLSPRLIKMVVEKEGRDGAQETKESKTEEKKKKDKDKENGQQKK